MEAFQQAGTFSYTARVVDPPSSSYPSGLARTGQPLFLNDFKLIKLGFVYRFTSNLPHDVHGTVGLVALVSVDSTLRNRYVLQKPAAFEGDAARVGGTFDLQQLQALIGQLSLESGAVGAAYTIELQPIVQIAGVVGEKPIKSTFSPVLPFTVTETLLKLNVTQPTALPGASYALPTGPSALTTALRPTKTGSIPGFAPNYASFARYGRATGSNSREGPAQELHPPKLLVTNAGPSAGHASEAGPLRSSRPAR